MEVTLQTVGLVTVDMNLSRWEPVAFPDSATRAVDGDYALLTEDGDTLCTEADEEIVRR